MYPAAAYRKYTPEDWEAMEAEVAKVGGSIEKLRKHRDKIEKRISEAVYFEKNVSESLTRAMKAMDEKELRICRASSELLAALEDRFSDDSDYDESLFESERQFREFRATLVNMQLELAPTESKERQAMFATRRASILNLLRRYWAGDLGLKITLGRTAKFIHAGTRNLAVEFKADESQIKTFLRKERRGKSTFKKPKKPKSSNMLARSGRKHENA